MRLFPWLSLGCTCITVSVLIWLCSGGPCQPLVLYHDFHQLFSKCFWMGPVLFYLCHCSFVFWSFAAHPVNVFGCLYMFTSLFLEPFFLRRGWVQACLHAASQVTLLSQLSCGGHWWQTCVTPWRLWRSKEDSNPFFPCVPTWGSMGLSRVCPLMALPTHEHLISTSISSSYSLTFLLCPFPSSLSGFHCLVYLISLEIASLSWLSRYVRTPSVCYSSCSLHFRY